VKSPAIPFKLIKGASKMTQNEIEIVKKCAAVVAKNYDPYESWIDPNHILAKFGIKEWEFCDGYWLDTETGVNYHFPF
jgi:hypothetical protein